jgi:hypothetical protein
MRSWTLTAAVSRANQSDTTWETGRSNQDCAVLSLSGSSGWCGGVAAAGACGVGAAIGDLATAEACGVLRTAVACGALGTSEASGACRGSEEIADREDRPDRSELVRLAFASRSNASCSSRSALAEAASASRISSSSDELSRCWMVSERSSSSSGIVMVSPTRATSGF